MLPINSYAASMQAFGGKPGDTVRHASQLTKGNILSVPAEASHDQLFEVNGQPTQIGRIR